MSRDKQVLEYFTYILIPIIIKNPMNKDHGMIVFLRSFSDSSTEF